MSFLDGKSVLVTGATGSIPDGFQYGSGRNPVWLTREDLAALLKKAPFEL